MLKSMSLFENVSFTDKYQIYVKKRELARDWISASLLVIMAKPVVPGKFL